MGKHTIKANELTSELDKISAVRRLQYTQVWGFDPLDLVTKQYVDEAIGSLNGFILNQDDEVQVADFRISGQGAATSFRMGLFEINDDTTSLDHMLWTTGLHTYAGMTITGASTFDIGAFTGFVIDNTDPKNPIAVEVIYPGSTGNTTPFLGTGPSTFVTADQNGVITYSSTEPSEAFYRTNILLGALAHPAGVLTSVSNKTDVLMGPMDQVRDMFRPIKYINDGVMPFPNLGGTLQLANTGGRLYGLGIGFVLNGKNTPSSLAIAAGAPTVFQYRTQTGGANVNTSLIDPANYDVAGVITPVGGGAGAATNQRVYLSETGVIRVQYGQTVYNSLNEAIIGSNTEVFTTFVNNRLFGMLIGIISIAKNATNLADPTQARILTVSKFGETVGGSAGIATGSLQTSYNNSASPEIITNGVNFALTIRRGSASDGDNIFEGQNGAGAVTSQIAGTGAITGTTLFATNNVQAQNNSTANNAFLAGTAAGTQGGDNNLLRSFAASSFLNLKGGAGRGKISIGDDSVDIISGAGSILFRVNAINSTSLGTTAGALFSSGNWFIGSSPTDNGNRFEVVGVSRFAGQTTIGTNSQVNTFAINGPAGLNRFVAFWTAGAARWQLVTTNQPESGSNAGSDFSINRHADAGSVIEAAFFIQRSSGFVGIGTTTVAPLSRLQVGGRITVTSPPSSEALRIIADDGFISFFNNSNTTRSAYIQSSLNFLAIEHEVGSRHILLNPTVPGNVGIQVNSPQAKLQVGAVNSVGVGEATFRGFIQINHNPSVSADGGLEFKLDASNNGYGKRILGVFNGASDYNLEFQSRTASASWSTNMAINSGANQSRVIAFKNFALADNLYTNSQFEARSDDGSPASIGFHRAGFSAVALYHLADGGDNILRIRTAGGNDYTIWHSGNLSPVAGSGTLDQVLTNGNISDPSGRFAVIGRICIGKSNDGHGVIGDGFVTTGTGNVYNYFNSNTATQIDFSNGNINLKTAPGGTGGNPITFTSRMFIGNSSGDVGIGTTSPKGRLHVSGSASIVSIPRNSIVLDNNGGSANASSIITFIKNGGTTLWEVGNDLGNSGLQTFYIYDGVAGSVRFIIDSLGNIGNNSSPQAKLHISGGSPNGAILVTGTGEAMRITDDAGFISFWDATNSQRTGYIQGQSSGRIIIQSEIGNTYILLNPDNLGNVGIGTNSPSDRLHINGNIRIDGAFSGLSVRGSSRADLRLSHTGAGVNLKHSFLVNENGATRFFVVHDDLASVTIDNIIRFDHSNGNVGVGTITLTEKLTVGGNVMATEFIRTSSIANKTNVVDYKDCALDILLDTKIRTYEKIDTGEFGIGFIAEDTNEILSGKNRDVHNFGAHLALLTKAIQELKEKNDQLEAEIKTLKGCQE